MAAASCGSIAAVVLLLVMTTGCQRSQQPTHERSRPRQRLHAVLLLFLKNQMSAGAQKSTQAAGWQLE
jgi:hypothetical protein